MTLEPTIFVAVAVFLFVVGIGLLVRPLKSESSAGPSSDAGIENSTAVHFRHLSQLRPVLAREDELFIERRLPSARAKKLQRERRDALRKYIVGIGKDFACLDRLAREVAARSPNVEHSQETERLFLELRFRVSYRVALLRLSAAGSLPFEAVAHLSEIVGTLSRQVEAMMISLQPLTAEDSARQPSHS